MTNAEHQNETQIQGSNGAGHMYSDHPTAITTDWAAPVFGLRTLTGATGLEDVVFRLWFWQFGRSWAGNLHVGLVPAIQMQSKNSIN